MKNIRLDLGGGDHIILDICDGGGLVESNLKSNGAGVEDKEFNAAIDVVESLVLAHACAGVDVKAPSYVEGVCTTLSTIAALY